MLTKKCFRGTITLVIVLRIIIDADACPVTKIAVEIARKNNIPAVCVCDTSHVMNIDYAEVVVVDKGADSADFTVVNLCSDGDVVITQDYGVASMALAKNSFAINQNGMYYTNDNIDYLMAVRHIASTERRKSSKHHLKGPKKRTHEDDEKFITAFTKLIEEKYV